MAGNDWRIIEWFDSEKYISALVMNNLIKLNFIRQVMEPD